MASFRLATYQSDRGPRAAILLGDAVYDASTATGSSADVSILSMLEEWSSAEQRLSAAALRLKESGESLKDVIFLPPVMYPSAIYCCGANYQQHMDNVVKFRNLPPQPSPKSLGLAPFHFLKAPRSIVSTETSVKSESPAFDFELELAVVIGRRARGVRASNALEYIAGYAIANDLSTRDRITRDKLPDSSPFRFDWNGHKNFDGACPMGPEFVPASSVADPHDLPLKTWVNGEMRQDSNTGQMVYSIGEQIEALTRFNTLYPGDVILTGTPAGVGAETGRYLKPGDNIRMTIGSLGVLTTRVV